MEAEEPGDVRGVELVEGPEGFLGALVLFLGEVEGGEALEAGLIGGMCLDELLVGGDGLVGLAESLTGCSEGIEEDEVVGQGLEEGFIALACEVGPADLGVERGLADGIADDGAGLGVGLGFGEPLVVGGFDLGGEVFDAVEGLAGLLGLAVGQLGAGEPHGLRAARTSGRRNRRTASRPRA